ERNIAYTVGIEKEGRRSFVEIDESFSVVSHQIHRGDLPVILIPEKDVEGKRFSPRMVQCLTVLESLRKTSPLWREIESVELLDDGMADVTLRGRPTVFTANADMAGFASLAAAAGWCDRNSKRPARLVLREDFTVIR
ncbi:MAG TPA: hypothetical protein VF857_02145, partial [Spirochaetota bacterium]